MLVISTILVVFVATFLAAAIAVLIASIILQRRSGESPENWAAMFGETPASPLLKSEELSTVSLLSSLLARFDFVKVMKAQLEEADLRWPVGRLTLMMLLGGSLTGALLGNASFLPSWVALSGGCAGGFLPYAYVLHKRKARLARFEEQLPDALDFLSRALRAGHPFAACLEMLVDESQPPLSAEIRKTCDERQLGMSWEQALDNLATRVPLIDIGFFAAAVQLQSRTGGKLGEVLGRLAETMRERFALRGEVRAIAAHGRMTGIVLTLIPVVVVSVMAVVNPGYLEILLGSSTGRNLLFASIGCLVLAHFVIRRIVNIKT